MEYEKYIKYRNAMEYWDAMECGEYMEYWDALKYGKDMKYGDNDKEYNHLVGFRGIEVHRVQPLRGKSTQEYNHLMGFGGIEVHRVQPLRGKSTQVTSMCFIIVKWNHFVVGVTATLPDCWELLSSSIK